MKLSLSTLAVAAGLAFAASGLSPALAETIKIGVTPGPHAQILEAVKPIAAKKGVTIEIVEFSDYVVPNQALDSGDIQANSFQHEPFLDNQKADRGFKIDNVASTVTFPLSIYSKKYKSWNDIPEGSTIAIQNDPTNGGRSLLLLQAKGLIKLKDGVGFKPSPLDITDNPKKLKFLEIEAAQTPRTLDDVAAASINTNYATSAGIDPSAIILTEDAKGPYVNIIAVRAADKDKPWVKTLVDSYHTAEVRDFITKTFKGSILPSW